MNKRTAKDRIHHSEKQLLEYSHFSPTKRLETFLTSLAPAIERIHSVLSGLPNNDYDKIDQLNKDHLHTDIQLIAYWEANNKISYISYRNAKLLKYPREDYEVIDILTGKCKKFGNVEFTCKRIAIDYSLEAICNRWLNEIPNILEFINKYQPDDETDE